RSWIIKRSLCHPTDLAIKRAIGELYFGIGEVPQFEEDLKMKTPRHFVSGLSFHFLIHLSESLSWTREEEIIHALVPETAFYLRSLFRQTANIGGVVKNTVMHTRVAAERVLFIAESAID
ncbi:MAG: hypothetical protein M3Y27_17760, partial [Acidobacteriota bacterium]|nr:hypothetical protein [Acidobacteriota bacterium]